MKNSAIAILLLFSLLAFAHGEDIAGPHGGNIKMPGAFHTEVVQVSPQTFKVYLLDINWKNPSMKDAILKISYKNKSPLGVACQPKEDHFFCELPKGGNLNSKSELLVEASREGAKGTIQKYSLPFLFRGEKKLEIPKANPMPVMDHSQHH